MFPFQPRLVSFAVGLTLILGCQTIGMARTLAESIIPDVQDKPGTTPGTVRGGDPKPLTTDQPQTQIGALRGPEGKGNCAAPKGDKALAALFPPVSAADKTPRAGATTVAYPTFLFYVPVTKASRADFLLEDDQGTLVYSTTFGMNGVKKGVISLALPRAANMPPLEIGKNYRWTFVLVCEPKNPAMNAVLEGYIQRVSSPQDLTSQLATAQGVERLALYNKAEIWYDAIATLAELRQANPGDAKLANDWNTLLKRVGLGAYASDPLAQ